MFETIPKIRIFINLLLILEIVIGVTIIAVTWFHHRILSTFLTETEEKMLTLKCSCIYILGFQLVVSFFCGLSLWARVWSRRYTDSIQLLLSVWLIFCFLIVVCGCATIWTWLTSCDSLSEGAEIILLKGIDIYYMNPEWKLLWDKLQYTRECCGVHGYQDWMHASWMSDNIKDYYPNAANCEEPLQYDYDSTTECLPNYQDSSAEYDNDVALLQPLPLPPHHAESPQILAPYACCKHNSLFCYENYMPHRKRGGGLPVRLPHLNLTEINTQGCLPLFNRHLTTFVHLLFILILLAVFIDCLICCLTKYLMATNYRRSYREFTNHNSCMFDDDGNALVVIKCPPNVRCITLEEQQGPYSESDIPNIASSSYAHLCCLDNRDATVMPEPDKRCGTEGKKHKTTFVH